MPNYSISEKECDPHSPCIDLSELSSYLLIPSKFIETHQRVKIYSNRKTLEIHYSILPSFFTHCQTYKKKPRQELEFLGIIHPNGQVEEVKIKNSAFVEGIFYFYTKRRTRKIVAVKNLPGGTHEEKDIKSTLSQRIIQQRLAFDDLCGRSATSTARI